MKGDFNTLHLLHAIREIPSDRITSTEKHVLTILLSCMNQSNDSWYKYDELAEFCSLSSKTVERTINILKAKNFIFVERPLVQGRGTPNHISINIDQVMIFRKQPNKKKFSVINVQKGDFKYPLNREKGDFKSQKGDFKSPPIYKEEEERRRRAREAHGAYGASPLAEAWSQEQEPWPERFLQKKPEPNWKSIAPDTLQRLSELVPSVVAAWRRGEVQ